MLEPIVSSTINRFVAYYRVSTAKQGASGLGLAAQRSAVATYLKEHGQVLAEFKEVESGRRSDRPALEQALAAARVHRVPIVVAKVDRLTRSVAFLSRLLESGVEVRFADLPAIEGPTGRFMLQQMAAVAELEAGLISTRTKAALAAAKKRGVKLGGFRGASISKAAHQASKIARGRVAARRAHDLMPTLNELQSEGVTSHEGLARALTDRRIPTSRGHTKWTGVQVARVLRRGASPDALTNKRP
ncbi:recombinase family protein [Bradyrhizobium ottawaense]|uniref:recombinase family protein n=1 Tax=Bradyrhizobium ottawaense TaxID=931866 RepID=UPI00384C351C